MVEGHPGVLAPEHRKGAPGYQQSKGQPEGLQERARHLAAVGGYPVTAYVQEYSIIKYHKIDCEVTKIIVLNASS